MLLRDVERRVAAGGRVGTDARSGSGDACTCRRQHR